MTLTGTPEMASLIEQIPQMYQIAECAVVLNNSASQMVGKVLVFLARFHSAIQKNNPARNPFAEELEPHREIDQILEKTKQDPSLNYLQKCLNSRVFDHLSSSKSDEMAQLFNSNITSPRGSSHAILITPLPSKSSFQSSFDQPLPDNCQNDNPDLIFTTKATVEEATPASTRTHREQHQTSTSHPGDEERVSSARLSSNTPVDRNRLH